MKKSTIVIAISIVCAFGIFTFLTLRKNKEDLTKRVYRADTNKAVFITWEQVKKKQITPAYTFTGSFEPNKEVQILPERGGKLVESKVELGDFVSKGKLIARLDNEELELQLEDLQTKFEDASRTFERNKVLVGGEALTKNAFEKSELALKGLQNSMAVVKKQMTYLNIFAPLSGYITSKNFEVGSIVSPGIPIALITDIGIVKLSILVPENAVTQFKEGAPIQVSCDAYPGRAFNGTVDYIAVKADDSKNFIIKIKVSNSATAPVRAGMFGKAYFKSTSPINTLIISRSAIVGTTKQPQVYVIENGVATLKNITLGRIIADDIEVLEGLSEGDLVANSGLVNLSNGIRVAQAGK